MELLQINYGFLIGVVVVLGLLGLIFYFVKNSESDK